MTIKSGITLILLIFANLVQAQPRCVHEGESIIIHPKAPKVCCEGLIRIPPPAGMVGTAGECVREEKQCVAEGKSIVIHPDAPQDCWEGLKIIPPPAGMLGTAGKCVREAKKCVEEGKSIVVVPGQPDICCSGLELERPEPGVLGTAGKCVQSSHPTPANVYDSRNTNKVDESFGLKKKDTSSVKNKTKPE